MIPVLPRPKIGFDFDEPIFPWYDYAHEVSVAAGLADANAEPPTVWDPTTVYGCTPEQWYEVLDDEVRKGDDGMYMRSVKPGVKEQIQRLYRAGYEIHIITARGSFGTLGHEIKNLTRRNLIREGIPFDTLTFAQDKGPVIRDLKIDYFLDDRYNNWFTAAKAGCQHPYLLNERWNREDPVPSWCRVDSTEEFVKLIIDRHGWQKELTPAQRHHVNG